MKEIHLTLTAIVANRVAKVTVETGGMMFYLTGPVSIVEPTETLYDGQIVYFPLTKTMSFEFTRKVYQDGQLLVQSVSGSLLPNAEAAANEVHKALHREFPIIGPAIMLSLRRFFNE